MLCKSITIFICIILISKVFNKLNMKSVKIKNGKGIMIKCQGGLMNTCYMGVPEKKLECDF